jgi:hypothetical protein
VNFRPNLAHAINTGMFRRIFPPIAEVNELIQELQRTGLSDGGQLTLDNCRAIMPLQRLAEAAVSRRESALMRNRDLATDFENPNSMAHAFVVVERLLQVVEINCGKLQDYLVWVPFAEYDALDLRGKALGLIAGREQKEAQRQNKRYKSFRAVFHPNTLGQVNECFTKLTIVGHGHSGYHRLATLPAGGDEVDYKEVANRLRAAGLPPTFAGHINVFACSAGAGSGWEKSFTEKLATWMRGT